MTHIKRQIGGGKASNSMRAQDSDDELSSLSPSPAPVTLCSKSQKAATESEDNIVEDRVPSLQKGTLKSTHSCKRVEVVLTKPLMKACKRAPSVIVVRGSSRSEETNIDSKCKVFGNSTEPFVSEDEQDPSTMHKQKAKSQQSSRPTKRMLSSLDTNTTQPSNLKAVKPSLRTRSLKKNPRLQIILLPNSESSDEDESEIHPPKDCESQSTPVPVQHPLSTKQLSAKQCKASFTCST